MYNITQQDYEMYYAIQEEYDKEYDEIVDELYHYMEAYVHRRGLDVVLFADCIENLLNIREHNEIIDYIKYIVSLSR